MNSGRDRCAEPGRIFLETGSLVAPLQRWRREKRTHVRHHQPQELTVRESGAGPGLRAAGHLCATRAYGARSCERGRLIRSLLKSEPYGTSTQPGSTMTLTRSSVTFERRKKPLVANMSSFPRVASLPGRKKRPIRNARRGSRLFIPAGTGRELAAVSVSANTRRTYEGGLRRLQDWLDGRSLDDTTLAEYMATRFEAGHSPAAASWVVTAIPFYAKLRGSPSPVGPATGRMLARFRRKGRSRGRGQMVGVRWEQGGGRGRKS